MQQEGMARLLLNNAKLEQARNIRVMRLMSRPTATHAAYMAVAITPDRRASGRDRVDPAPCERTRAYARTGGGQRSRLCRNTSEPTINKLATLKRIPAANAAA